MRKLAYCIIPKIGGTYRFFTSLQKHAQELGWKVHGVSTGPEVKRWDSNFVTDDCVGVSPAAISIESAARGLCKWVEENEIDVLMPMSSVIAAAAIPHLPGRCRVIMRCNSITRHAYQIVELHPRHAQQVIATSPRQRADLIARGTPASKIGLIPHGTAVTPMYHPRPDEQAELRICYTGRISNYDKGVFLLPEIARHLANASIAFTLTIAGDGPDMAKLRRKCAAQPCADKIRFVGKLPHPAVVELLAESHLMLMPSNFEGFGFSLLESMAAGCVPAASKIAGVTDFIVDDQRTGLLFPIGDAEAAARAIEHAYRTGGLKKMGLNAVADVDQRFTAKKMAASYFAAFDEALTLPVHRTSESWDSFDIPKAFQPTWRRFIPAPLKARLRQLVERRAR